MTTIAISNLPASFNQDKLLPEFNSRGIDSVIFYSSSQFRNLSRKFVSEMSRIFMFVDIMSHSDYHAIKDLIKKSGNSIEILNRKSASWPERFSQEDKMAATKSVMESEVPNLIREWDACIADPSISNKQIVDRIKKYWTGRPLTNFQQAKAYILRMKAIHPVLEESSEPDVVIENIDVPNNSESDTKALDNKPNVSLLPSETQEWVSMLEEDNAAKARVLAETQDELTIIRNELQIEKKARIEAEKRAASAASSKVSPVFQDQDILKGAKEAAFAIRKLVELGVMTHEEGLEKIMKSILLLKV